MGVLRGVGGAMGAGEARVREATGDESSSARDES
jgi:hypothetical protein